MEQAAAAILKKNIYAAVATANVQAQPWNSPVYVVFDSQLNFYWASGKTSQHSRNILENPLAFLAVYDSTVPWGTGTGVFMQGTAAEVTDIGEIAKVCQLRKTRIADAKHPPEDFLPDKPRSIYKVIPSKIWIKSDGRVDGYFVDERTELSVDELRHLLAG